MVLVVSGDGSLVEVVRKAYRSGWRVETRDEAVAGREILNRTNVRMVVVDDSALIENERGWLLHRIRRSVPDAFVVYVAAQHSPEVEREARASGAAYYASKPIDGERLARVLHEVAERLVAAHS